MNNQVFGKISEKIIHYDDVQTHIRTPEGAEKIAFIAHGSAVHPNDPLILTMRDAMNAQGFITVIPDLGTQADFGDPGQIHAAFAAKMKTAIDGYAKDHQGTPKTYTFIGHSIGGAAMLSLAKDYTVDKLTVLDPTPLDSNIFKGVNCPTDVILSSVRSFKSSGRRMQADIAQLSPHQGPHKLHQLSTSSERALGHMFRGNETDIAHILRQNDDQTPAPHPEP